MKKIYLNPTTEVIKVVATSHLLEGSGVKDGGTPGDEYNSSDVTYSRRRHNSDWDDDDYDF